jgi:hypothetical protein
LARAIWIAAFAVLLTSCQRAPEPLRSFATRLSLEIHALESVLTGGRSPLRGKKPQALASPGVLENYEHRAALTKAHAEILRELFEVVFLRSPQNRGEFGNYLDSMNQGASIEGIYNGFTHSDFHRELEKESGPASRESLLAFCRELSLLEAELPEPTAFDESSARPLAPSVSPAELAHERVVNEVSFASPSPRASNEASEHDPRALEARYVRLFAGASIFTMKRILGDEAIKVIESKERAPEKLALWYGQLAARMAGEKVDFGLALRNRADEKFHQKWALDAVRDRRLDQLTWEVLNRLHRVMNHTIRTQAHAGN